MERYKINIIREKSVGATELHCSSKNWEHSLSILKRFFP